MTIIVALLAPFGTFPNQVVTASGASYVPNAQGIVFVAANDGDIADLISDGWTVLPGFGSGGQPIFPEGNIVRQVGNPLAQPAATGSDQVLASFVLPAGTFDLAGRGIWMQAKGSFAANANAKRVKLFFNATIAAGAVTGGSLVADSGAASPNGVGWQIEATVFKYGNAGSNTQLGQAEAIVVGAAHLGTNAPLAIAAPENGPITVALTGNATTTATDISATQFVITAQD